MYGRDFQELYPNADLSRFTQTDWYGDSSDAVYFKSKDGLPQVFDKSISNKYYFTNKIKKALGHPAELNVPGIDLSKAIPLSNFPQELTLNSKPKLPVPVLVMLTNLKLLISLTLRSLSHRQLLSR